LLTPDEFIKQTDRPISASTRPSSSRFGGNETDSEQVSDFIPRKRILDYGIEELRNVDQIRVLLEKEQQQLLDEITDYNRIIMEESYSLNQDLDRV